LNQEEIMTTLENRPNTALLVVDIQYGVVAKAHARTAVMAKISVLVEKARRDQIPVIWIQHSDDQLVRGSEEWRIVPELAPHDDEPWVEKNFGDAFEDTNLENVLSSLNVGRLFVVGAQTDACIRSTLHGAFVRGYDTTLVSDAHATEDQTTWGGTAAGQGYRTYELVLDLSDGSGSEGRDERDQGRRLRRHAMRRDMCHARNHLVSGTHHSIAKIRFWPNIATHFEEKISTQSGLSIFSVTGF
jgi:nicotinamidase-related amidase